MSLPPPIKRIPIHTRRVTCEGFRRADGLWDIEGRLTDVKTYTFDNHDRGRIEPGDPIHDMRLRVTIDDDFIVRDVEAMIDKSPFGVCGSIAPNFRQLVGLRIGPGWNRAVRERLGGVRGCTHLVELLGPVATTAFQTIYPILSRERAGDEGVGANENDKPPRLLNSCHAFASDGTVVRHIWPAFYTGKER